MLLAMRSLLAHADFRKLWAGHTASQAGTFVGQTALPLLAATVLAATPMQMGVLTAAEHAAFLLLGLPAGAWVDRLRKRPLMIRADLLRAAVLLSIPVAWWFGVLTLAQLVVVALLAGVGTLFFDVAAQSYLPALVGRANLVDGNAKLQASQSIAQITGPGLGGGLTQLAGAANTMSLTGVSYLASALCVARIKVDEPMPDGAGRAGLRAEIAEGLRFVFGNRRLRAIVGCTASANLANGAFTALVVLFLTRQAGLAPAGVGAVLAAGGAGGVLGALTAGRWTRRFGTARTIWLALVVTSPVLLLFPFAANGWRIWLAAGSLLVFDYGVIVYNIAQVSYRQTLCPDRLLGRMNASVRFVVWGALPVGGLLGGLLGQSVGLRGGLWIAIAAEVLAVLWVLCSPLRYDPS